MNPSVLDVLVPALIFGPLVLAWLAVSYLVSRPASNVVKLTPDSFAATRAAFRAFGLAASALSEPLARALRLLGESAREFAEATARLRAAWERRS